MLDEVYECFKDDFVLCECGYINVKGKGVMCMWYFIGCKVVVDFGEVCGVEFCMVGV